MWKLLAVVGDAGSGQGSKQLVAGRRLLRSRIVRGGGKEKENESPDIVLGGDGSATTLSLELSLPPSSPSEALLLRCPVDLLLVSGCYAGLDVAARLPPLGVLLSLVADDPSSDPSSSSGSLPSGEGSPWSAAEIVAAAMREGEEAEGEGRS